MQATVSREVAAHKRVALVAHDNKKMDLVRWVKVRSEQLKLHHLYATGTTGTILSREAGLPSAGSDRPLAFRPAIGCGRRLRLMFLPG